MFTATVADCKDSFLCPGVAVRQPHRQYSAYLQCGIACKGSFYTCDGSLFNLADHFLMRYVMHLPCCDCTAPQESTTATVSVLKGFFIGNKLISQISFFSLIFICSPRQQNSPLLYFVFLHQFSLLFLEISTYAANLLTYNSR